MKRRHRARAGTGAASLALSAFLGCQAEPPPVADESSSRRVESSRPDPEESRPLRQGYTQRPPRDAPGLPPSPAPFLSDEDRDAAEEALEAVTDEARAAAKRELLRAVEAFEASGDVAAVRRLAREQARAGLLEHMSANAMFEIFLFPNDADEASDRYGGRPVVLTGRVAPHNMTDAADGFKLFEQTAYSHEPVLLETEQELVFVRCRLLRPELQKLKDWQTIHVLAFVVGKDRGDLVLDRGVVLSN